MTRQTEILDPPLPIVKNYRQLIGCEDDLKRLIAVVSDRSAKSIIGIDGMGGIGKSALAQEVADLCHNRGLFQQIIWISGADDPPVPGSELTFETILDAIAQQVGMAVTTSAQERSAQIKLRLRRQAVLLVLDNLDNAILTQQELFMRLQPLLGLSKVIATSRQRFNGDIFEVHLKGLTDTAGRHFLLQEGRERGFESLTTAARAELEQIVTATGGAPLAMKLVVGQLNLLPLTQILENLQRVRLAETSTVDEYVNFYHAIYLPSWRLLSQSAQDLLIWLAIFSQSAGGSFAAIQAVSTWEAMDLSTYLRELWRFSLVETQRLPGMGLNENRYYLHALTRYFVKSDLFKRTVIDEQTLTNLYATGNKRYITYFLTYLATYHKDYARLDLEMENIAEALRLASHSPTTEHLLSYVNQFATYLLVRGHYYQVEQLLQQALVVASTTAQPNDLTTMLVIQGQVLMKRGALLDARQTLEGALDHAIVSQKSFVPHPQELGWDKTFLDIYTQQQNLLQIADVLQTLAEVELNFSDYAAAAGYLQRALAYAQAQNDRKRMAQILGLSGRCACMAANFGQADTLLQKALTAQLSLAISSYVSGDHSGYLIAYGKNSISSHARDYDIWGSFTEFAASSPTPTSTNSATPTPTTTVQPPPTATSTPTPVVEVPTYRQNLPFVVR